MTSSPAEGRILGQRCEVCDYNTGRWVYDSVRGAVYWCLNCEAFFVQDNGLTPTGQEALFYSTVDAQKYITYFGPFRKRQYRYVLQKLGLKPGSSLLDVGASFGGVVEVGLELGLDSFGLEPGDMPVKSDIAPRMIRSSLEEFVQTVPRCFDAVTIWHVLEHLQKPVESIKQLSQLVKKGGYLVIAVPTTDGWMFRLGLLLQGIFGSPRLLYELFYFHNANMHFFYYNSKSVETLLERVNMRPCHIETIESFDWWTVYRRVESPVRRLATRVIGPFLALSGFTRRENLIVVARK